MAVSRREFLAGVAALSLGACTAESATVQPESAGSTPTGQPPDETTAPDNGPATTGAAKEAPTTTAPTTTAPTTTAPTTTAPTPTTTATNPATTVTSSPGGPARFVRRGPADRPEVALTFHGAGAPALTDKLLLILGRTRAAVTIFAVGSWLEDNPGLVTRLGGAGHEVANHTYSHPSLGSLGAGAVAEEIGLCRDVLVRQIGSPSAWFRPSGIEIPTATILTEAGRAGYPTVVGYDVDSLDFTDPGASAVIANTVTGLHPGAIVSLHTGHQDTIDAMSDILAALQQRGLSPVTVSRLLRP